MLLLLTPCHVHRQVVPHYFLRDLWLCKVFPRHEHNFSLAFPMHFLAVLGIPCHGLARLFLELFGFFLTVLGSSWHGIRSIALALAWPLHVICMALRCSELHATSYMCGDHLSAIPVSPLLSHDVVRDTVDQLLQLKPLLLTRRLRPRGAESRKKTEEPQKIQKDTKEA